MCLACCWVNASTKAVLATFLLLVSHGAARQRSTWIATWGTSPEAAEADPEEALLNLENQTVRERIRVTLGGPQIRIRLSNEYSSSPVLVGAVSVGSARSKSGVVPGSLRGVTFGGKSGIVIPAGATALSDPISLAVTSGAELAISLYFPKRITSVTWHSLALRDAVIAPHGDHTEDVTIEGGQQSSSSVFLSQVLVPNQAGSRVIVAFGDSLVDGDKSTPEADRAWPSDLFRRLQKVHNTTVFAVVNEGVAGNRLLRNGPVESLGVSGLTRFERDALGVPGVTDIVLLEGTNDIGFPGASRGDFLMGSGTDAPAAADIIGGYRQLISQAHARGVRIIGCTITPTEGATFADYYSEPKDRVRQAVNHWIRTSKAFDGVIDFDAVMRDPNRPSRMIPNLSSKDHLHPNDDGYERMAEAVDLSFFR